MSLNVIMLGPPGAGKGTQAERLARVRGVPRVSTGDILRDAVASDSDFGRQMKAIMARGELVSDDVMNGIVRERLNRADARDGFILDGFPRTVDQAEKLDAMINGRGPLVVVDIVVPEIELVRRLGARMICSVCGTNAGDAVEALSPADRFAPSSGAGAVAAEGVATAVVPTQSCKSCGGALVQRADDNQGVVLERLKVYHRQTEPLVEYYRQRPTFRSVNGAQSPDRVASDLAMAVDSARDGQG